MKYAKGKVWLAVAVIAVIVVMILFSQMPPTTSLAQEPTPTVSTSQATTTEQQPLVSVSGTGQVPVQPDVAVFTVGVETEASDPGTAISENSQQAQNLIDTLRQAGIPAENNRPSSSACNPSTLRQRRAPNRRVPPKSRGTRPSTSYRFARMTWKTWGLC